MGLVADAELCEAIEEVRKGQADDLAGGVFKKRLNKNMHRSIILAKGGRYWIYEFLFAKKDQANVNDEERTKKRANVRRGRRHCVMAANTYQPGRASNAR
jgi:hypothetical protein